MNNPFIKEMASKTELIMERWLTGEALGRWLILILTGEEDFPIRIRYEKRLSKS